MDLFRGSELFHGTHGEPDLDENGVKWGIKKTARTLKGPPSEEFWKQHLEGKRALGVITIREDSTCYWGSIDVDIYDIDELEVIKKIDAAKLPLVPCRSKSGGLHLFMFCESPTDASTVQNVLRDIAAGLGFAGSEIFPKQTKVMVNKGDQGNWMVMPYFGGDFNGKLRMQYGLKKNGAEMTLEEFVTYAEKKLISTAAMDELRMQLATRGTTSNSKKSKDKEAFSNGPPCLQHLARGGFPEGGRNNALFHIGVFHRRANPDDWQVKVEQDNQLHMKPPLPSEEVQAIIRSLKKKDYEYKCHDQPMEKHCDPIKCRGRKYGVGDGQYPIIEGMRKLMTEPALYFIDIPGGTVMVTTEQLTNYRKFHNLCLEYTNVSFKLISDHLWNTIYTEAMQKCEKIEAPPEAKSAGRFMALMATFLTNRTLGEKKEDLLRNVPWDDEEGGQYVFSLAAVVQFMKRENNKEFNQNEIVHRLGQDLGAKKRLLDIKGKRNIRYWAVDKSRVEQAPELDPPNPEKEVI